MRFDHIIIAVRDLDAAIADYRALGFAVYYGGVHTHKQTHNGLISLADGSYLELLAPTDPKNVDETSGLLAHGEGFAGYALLSTDLAADAARLQASRLPFEGPLPGRRTRYDGELVAWQSINIGATRTPFLIADETPHLLRVPDDEDKVGHNNGAIGVAGLVVAVPDLAAAVARYRAILGTEPRPGIPIQDASTANFALDGSVVTLATPTTPVGDLARHLERCGETPYLLRLQSRSSATTGRLSERQSHGAWIELAKAETAHGR